MGRRCHFRFRVPANHLASTFFLPVSGDSLGLLDVTPYSILYPSGHQVQTSVFPFWPGFVTLGIDPHYYGVLTVILWWLATVNSRTGSSSNFISIVSVGYHVTRLIQIHLHKCTNLYKVFWLQRQETDNPKCCWLCVSAIQTYICSITNINHLFFINIANRITIYTHTHTHTHTYLLY